MASAKDVDPAFSTISHKPGMDVWRVMNMAVVAVPKAEHGKFYSGDSYVVLKTTGLKSGGVSYAIHFWLGKETSQDEQGVAAIKSVELDAALGGKAVQYREVQGHESDLFLSYFRPCIIALPGGVASGFRKVTEEKFENKLFQVKGRRFLHVRQIPFARSSLTHNDVYIVDTKDKIYQFNGANANRFERGKAFEVVQLLKDSNHGGSSAVAIIEDGKLDDPDSNEFWDLFGGFAPIAKKGASEDDQDAKVTPPVLYWASPNGLHEVAKGGLKKNQLEGNKCFIVDIGPELFVWFGRISSLDDRKAAGVAAERLVSSSKRPPSTKISHVVERFEPAHFKANFAEWPLAPVIGDGGSKLKAMLKKSGVVDKALSKIDQASAGEPVPALADVVGDFKVFRLNGKDKIALPAEEVGQFYSGDCYIALYSYVKDRKHEYILFFWIGKSSTPEERVSASAVAQRHADALRGHVTYVRLVQGKEPEQFFSLFKQNLYFFKGGLSASYKAKHGDDAYDPSSVALFLTKPRDNGLFVANQLDLVARSLNSAECFVLLSPQAPFVWVGKSSTEAEKSAAFAAADLLKPGVAVKQMPEGKETSIFWGFLGGKGDYPGQKESKGGAVDGRLFHVTGSLAAFKIQEIPNFTQDDLISEDIMLLDLLTEVFIWVGAHSSDQERKEAFDLGVKFLDQTAATEGRSKDTTLIKITEGFEPPMFTSHFQWDPTKTALFVDPYERRLASLLGRPMELSDAAKRKLGTLQGATPAAAAPAAEPEPSSPAPAEPAAKPAPSAAESAASQRAAAIAALTGSISGVKAAPPEPVPEPAAPAPVPAAVPAAQSPPVAESASTQRAAALAALSGTLTAEKKPVFKISSPTPAPASSQTIPEPLEVPLPAAAEPAASDEPPTPEAIPSPGTPGAESLFFPLERLTISSSSPIVGIDTTKREAYLSDSDFEQVFGVTKDKFYAMPKWKQDQKKRNLNLF